MITTWNARHRPSQKIKSPTKDRKLDFGNDDDLGIAAADLCRFDGVVDRREGRDIQKQELRDAQPYRRQGLSVSRSHGSFLLPPSQFGITIVLLHNGVDLTEVPT